MAKETNVKLVTVSVFVATFMTAIEGTIVSTAMPTIVGSLHGMEIELGIFNLFINECDVNTDLWETCG